MKLRAFNPFVRSVSAENNGRSLAADVGKAIKAFIRKGGEARRFEPGFSTDFRDLKEYLIARGVKIVIRMNRVYYRNKMLKPAKFYELVDAERMKEGKPPIITTQVRK